jgi:hypothetical protein
VFTTTFYLVVSVCSGWPVSIIQNMINGEGDHGMDSIN